MADFLAAMARASEDRARRARRGGGAAALRRRATACPPPPSLVLDPSGFDLIAEVKRASPLDGSLASPRATAAGPACVTGPVDAGTRAVAYAEGGAAAVSILTEPMAFGGALADVTTAARALGDSARPVPVLRKDFLVDPVQLFEARAHGAGGALLVLRLLDEQRLSEMIDAAGECGLWLLLEAFDAGELRRASEAATVAGGRGVRALVGLNVRDLASLQVVPARLERLSPLFPRDVAVVAESGISFPADAARAVALGCRMALVGTALMRAADPRVRTAEILEAGRAASDGAPVTAAPRSDVARAERPAP